jgi:pimeloyl-ACP methyl ester carboxylesterase
MKNANFVSQVRQFVSTAIGVLLLLPAAALPARAAAVVPFPASFTTRTIQTNGTSLFVRVGGHGPAVVLLHGFGDTGDMWAPLAAALVSTHTVIVPDLRGFGNSAKPADGYGKMNEGKDIAGILDALQIQSTQLVTHDIGNMVGFAFAAQFPTRVIKFVLMDAPLPGIGPWYQGLTEHRVWHFSFYGPDEERLVAGRERIYLDRFYNEFSSVPARWDEAARAHYAGLYAQPGAMHSAMEQFRAFDQDSIDNETWMRSHPPLSMPVLAIGGEKSYGISMGSALYPVASDVRIGVIPDAGHWIMEEQPNAAIAMITAFLASNNR